MDAPIKPLKIKAGRSERIRLKAKSAPAREKPFKPKPAITVDDADETLDRPGQLDHAGGAHPKAEAPSNVVGIGTAIKPLSEQGNKNSRAQADYNGLAKAIGRPSNYNAEVAEAVVRHITGGGHIERLKELYGIHPQTIWVWRQKHPEFNEAVERAQEARAELWADQLVSIADDPLIDPNDRRVRVDTRWKVIGSLLYRRYGVKAQVDVNQKIDIGTTAAEVLMRLTERAKQAKMERLIDVTPSREE